MRKSGKTVDVLNQETILACDARNCTSYERKKKSEYEAMIPTKAKSRTLSRSLSLSSNPPPSFCTLDHILHIAMSPIQIASGGISKT